MADSKISDLSAITALLDTDIVEIGRPTDPSSKKITVASLRSALGMWQVKRVGTQLDITSAGFVDITNLNFAVVSGNVYAFRAFVPYRSSATAMGVLFGYNGPAMTNTVVLSEKTITTPGTASTDMLSSAILTANDTPLPVSSAEPTSGAVDMVWRVEGTMIPSANGTFSLRMSKENVAGTASAMPSGFLEWRDIT